MSDYRYHRKKIILKTNRIVDGKHKRTQVNLNESAIIKGEAGIEKTTLMDNLFITGNMPVLRWFQEHLLQRYCIRCTYREVISSEELRSLIKELKCNKLILLIDGFDEPYSNFDDVKQGQKNSWSLPKHAEDKYARFRAFDLATIYTFMINRRDWKPDDEERKIISDCIIDIDGVGEEKRKIMKELKNKIISLL